MTPITSPDEVPSSAAPLAGVRVIEVSSSGAAALCGMALARFGAEVIRIDPFHGSADDRGWPATAVNNSIHRAGADRGKRSFSADFRDPRAHDLIRDLILEAGTVVTHTAGRDWLAYSELAAARPDLIHVQLGGRADGGTAGGPVSDAALGAHLDAGPASPSESGNHGPTASDTAFGFYAALSVVSAVYRREISGAGSSIVLPGEGVTLVTTINLGHLADTQPCPPIRPAPADGQDTAPILAEHLGLTPDEIHQLVASGIIRTTDKEAE